MSTLEEKLQDARRHIDYSGTADVPSDVFDVVDALVSEVETLKEGLQNLRELVAMRGPVETGGMSRADALKLAREHVEAMSTNSRGYQDGVKLSDKVQAMNAFARFLMGEDE
ncbi:hypothetical protein PV332_10505 [Streptomyces scabiei]|uniref:hypothetical protein n=1 Tax=Streptomyces scabiei TaxID=1930 RepID=UPI0029BA924E|nr:hypothetical protein [Streptomyces scabiei]MDX2575911.1 hypothetical protein [Streptomyces scabiei]MDX2885616.1 hypothetical protein [Streptomyces scabiei]MDX2993431.1 hypothetical protein [Streptomyces scabiei]MDX3028455.1 hypothetical protein [Streptomyces scabiei]MDX3047211.1 hypothetical protein [Streptomyces scabiei]